VPSPPRRPSAAARIGVLHAIRHYPLLAATPVVALALLGALLGYARTPTYTATAQVAVGQLNVSDPAAVGSVVQATNSLAAVYSRLIDSTDVRKAIAKSAGSKAAGSEISATPIPSSPLIRVTATGTSAGTAIDVANASASSLLKASKRYSTSPDQSESAYADFKAAALNVSRDQAKVGALTAVFMRSHSASDKQRLVKAQSDLDAAKLKRDTLRFAYGTSSQGEQASPVLRSFSVAGGASSDRISTMEILTLLGLLAGIAVGAALATAKLNRRVGRLTGP
jgi:copper(I)-binding protein